MLSFRCVKLSDHTLYAICTSMEAFVSLKDVCLEFTKYNLHLNNANFLFKV